MCLFLFLRYINHKVYFFFENSILQLARIRSGGYIRTYTLRFFFSMMTCSVFFSLLKHSWCCLCWVVCDDRRTISDGGLTWYHKLPPEKTRLSLLFELYVGVFSMNSRKGFVYLWRNRKQLCDIRRLVDNTKAYWVSSTCGCRRIFVRAAVRTASIRIITAPRGRIWTKNAVRMRRIAWNVYIREDVGPFTDHHWQFCCTSTRSRIFLGIPLFHEIYDVKKKNPRCVVAIYTTVDRAAYQNLFSYTSLWPYL